MVRVSLDDGKPLALAQTQHALLGAWVPPGHHKLDLRFQPPHWQLAVAINLAALGVLALLCGIALRQRLRRAFSAATCS